MASTKAFRQPSPLFSSPDSTELQARLALLRHTAEKVTNALLTKSSAYNRFKVEQFEPISEGQSSLQQKSPLKFTLDVLLKTEQADCFKIFIVDKCTRLIFLGL